MGLGKSKHAVWLGFAYAAQSAIEKRELQTFHQSRLPSHISSDQGTCSVAHNVQQWADSSPPQSHGLIGNWNGEWEALARLALLPVVYTSTVAEPNIPSKGGKTWV